MKTRKKGQRSPFCRVLVVFKKLMHKNLIREIDEVAIQRLRFPRFRHDSLIYRAKHRQVAQNAWAV
jgi:hypothetical protein